MMRREALEFGPKSEMLTIYADIDAAQLANRATQFIQSSVVSRRIFPREITGLLRKGSVAIAASLFRLTSGKPSSLKPA